MENYRLLNKTEAICWHCENCSPLKCEWVLFSGDKNKLPKGAKTTIKYLRYKIKKEPVYIILKCPNFKGENEKKYIKEMPKNEEIEKVLNSLGNKEFSVYEIIEQLQRSEKDKKLIKKIHRLKDKGKIQLVRQEKREDYTHKVNIYRKSDN